MSDTSKTILSVQEYVEKSFAALTNLSKTQAEEILKNPQDYAFDAKAEKFFKPKETQFKTVVGLKNFINELNDGWNFDEVLTPGEYPGEYRVRKRFYLEAESSL